MIDTDIEQLPVFLQTYGNLIDHVTSQLSSLQNKGKGDSFTEFTSKIIPLTDIGVKLQLEDIRRRKASYDEGVDLQCISSSESQTLNVQCKLTLKDVDEFDLIISKFHAFYKKFYNISDKPMQTLFEDFYEEDHKNLPDISFMIATLSNLSRILPTYEKSNRSSKQFYYKLKESDKLHILDGPTILPIVQAAYRKLHILPTDVGIHLDSPFIQKGNVYIGIISAAELKACYNKFGDALFLDNLRTFLGNNSGKKKTDGSRENVNEAIIETATQYPEKMLAKNNGITFRAKKVTIVDNHSLKLDDASIVNGCQTTMCLVKASKSEETFVLAKIVEASDSWDIAKAANFQNKVEEIELVLARYIRPQLVKSFESKAEIHVVQNADNSVFDVFSSIYKNQVAYEEIYYLFIGLFSKNINNVVNTNYTELDDGLLEALRLQTDLSEKAFYTLFKLYQAAAEARGVVEKKYNGETYKKIFQRFWKENKPNYRSLLTILATCGCIQQNIYKQKPDFSTFLQSIGEVLDNDEAKFVRYYQYAFEAIAAYLLSSNKSESEILRTMYDELRTIRFDNIYNQLRLFADGREPQH